MDTLYIFYPVAASPKKLARRPSCLFSTMYKWMQRVIGTIFGTSWAKPPRVSMTLHDFQEKSWGERFKTVFPVDKDKDIERIYKKLLEIRDSWRNVIEHGFRSKEATLLIPMPGLGLVPISYTSASKAIHFAITPSPENGIREALDMFSSFETWVMNNQQTLYVILYAQSGFPIPLEEQRLQEIRAWMSSPAAFKQALEAEEKELEYLLDQYQ